MFFNRESTVAKSTNCCSVLTYDYDYHLFDFRFEYFYNLDEEVVFLSHIPDLNDVEKIYPSTYGAYSSTNFGLIGGAARRLAAFFKIRRIKHFSSDIQSIIEFGCGSKPLAIYLSSKFTSITLADVVLPNSYGTHNLIVGNIEETIFNIPDESYDLIILNQVIEHLANPDQFIKNVFRILKPGGLFYLETPNINGYDAKFSLRSGLWGGLHAPRHFVLYSNFSIISLLNRAGLSIVKSGSLYNPFLINNTIRNFIIKSFGRESFLLYFFRLNNPIVLILYFLADSFAMFLRKETGNLYAVAKKLDLNL